MNLYVAMVDDRHTDPAAHLFSTPEKAIEWARQHYEDHEPDDLSEAERADAGIGEHELHDGWLYHATYSTEGCHDGWLYHATYSTEGCSVWVLAAQVDAP